MPRSPESCRHRTLVSGGRGAATCDLVRRVTGVPDTEFCLAQADACQACCRSLAGEEAINPVVASLIYHAASRIVAAGGHPRCSLARGRTVLQYATDRLSVIVDEFPDRSYPAEWDSRREGRTPPGRLGWTVGLLTAPRRQPTLERTLRSLRAAGFSQIQVFAEPGAWIPADCGDLRVSVHERRLGNFVNFYSSLSRLLLENPTSDAFAMFQDDIEAAQGLRAWCDEQFWPLEAGVVSLFTPRLHADRVAGWRLLVPGYNRVCGAQALVFRRDTLREFLSDPRIVAGLQTKVRNDDTAVAEWVALRGTGMAYHTPSPVQHIGEVSSLYAEGPDRRNVADAVSSVEQIRAWRPPPAHGAKVGLVGWNTATGLGYLNRDLAAHFPIARWLIPQHPNLPTLDRIPAVRMDVVDPWPDDGELRRWLQGLDWVLFAERPYLDNLPRVAAIAGVGVACVPMWEWINPDMEWLSYVDVMLCPTRRTALEMEDWKGRYGFGWEVVEVPWPIDAERFPFRERGTCRRFLFVNGWGGGAIRRLDGSEVNYRRKGLELVVEAARLAPQHSWIVHSQEPLAGLPANIEVRASPADNRDLYAEGDVCVQPSHFEGMGLQLLECQAAGMPLVTTAAPPMDEYQPLRTIPVRGTEVIHAGGPAASQWMDPRDLAVVLEHLVGTDLREASRRAREFVVRHHAWESARGLLQQAMRRR